tara:strand:+ start:674 stop:874 length:201 start_codon:yes stop_codon:yes gene_type:complete
MTPTREVTTKITDTWTLDEDEVSDILREHFHLPPTASVEYSCHNDSLARVMLIRTTTTTTWPEVKE